MRGVVERWGAGVILVVFGVLGCDTGATEPQDIVFPDSGVSYSRHVQPLFDLG